jgi:hypothetical protein
MRAGESVSRPGLPPASPVKSAQCHVTPCKVTKPRIRSVRDRKNIRPANSAKQSTLRLSHGYALIRMRATLR